MGKGRDDGSWMGGWVDGRCLSSLDGSEVRYIIGELDIDVWWADGQTQP